MCVCVFMEKNIFFASLLAKPWKRGGSFEEKPAPKSNPVSGETIRQTFYMLKRNWYVYGGL